MLTELARAWEKQVAHTDEWSYLSPHDVAAITALVSGASFAAAATERAEKAEREREELAKRNRELREEEGTNWEGVEMSEPIYKQVMRDVEARAEVGKKTYGRYLVNDPNGRDPLQDAYEEALDMAKYLKQTGHDRRALLEYVGRLEGAMRQIRGTCARTLAEPETDTETLVIVCTSVEKALATSPLTGQPLQKVQQFGWRPIAEAPRDGTAIEAGDPDSGFVRVVQYASEYGGAWYLLGSADTYYAFDSFKVFRPVPTVPAPPKEGGVGMDQDRLIEDVKRTAEYFRAEAAELRRRVAALERELVDARKDGARLDWVESQCVFQMTVPQFWRNRNGKISFAPFDEAKLVEADNVRAAIDAAIKEAK